MTDPALDVLTDEIDDLIDEESNRLAEQREADEIAEKHLDPALPRTARVPEDYTPEEVMFCNFRVSKADIAKVDAYAKRHFMVRSQVMRMLVSQFVSDLETP